MAHSQICCMLVVGQRPEFLSMRTSPQGYLSVLITWLLASSRVKEEKERNQEEEKGKKPHSIHQEELTKSRPQSRGEN